MAATTLTRSWMIIAALALCIVVVSQAWPVMIDHLPQVDSPLSEHAIAKHGDDASSAKKCANEEGQGYLFFNTDSQRWAIVCWLGDRWGIVILTATWIVITAYVTSKLKTIERMRKYMQRQGYQEK